MPAPVPKPKPSNRNGLVGDYAAHAPRPLSRRETMDRIKAQRGADPGPPERESSEVGRVGSYALVRHRLWSRELNEAAKALGQPGWHGMPESAGCTAVFGIVDAEGRTRALIETLEDWNQPPEIFLMLHDRADPPPPDVALGFLRLLDIAPAANAGADIEIADAFDAAWDREAGGWNAREAVRLVKVTFERTCFATSPTLRESVDVVVLADPAHDLADPDPDRAYWAKHHYREAAMAEFGGQATASRPGFSSWTFGGDPVPVKVLNGWLDPEIARLRAEAAEEAAAEGEATGPRP